MGVRSGFGVACGPSTASLANQAPVYCGCPAGTHGCDLVSRVRTGSEVGSHVKCCEVIVESWSLSTLVFTQTLENLGVIRNLVDFLDDLQLRNLHRRFQKVSEKRCGGHVVEHRCGSCTPGAGAEGAALAGAKYSTTRAGSV